MQSSLLHDHEICTCHCLPIGVLMLMGCMYHKITNLTPGARLAITRVFTPWKSLESNQRTVRYETVQPQVMIGATVSP